MLTVYPFGSEEYHYTAGGAPQSSLHYDDLGGQLLDERSGSTNTLLLTDALGSVIATVSNTQNNAAVLGNQLYGPYGTQRLQAGTIDTRTSRGFTGQYNDPVTGLDYYGARYYDPSAGVFLAADSVQGNAVGMNPYGYVDGNPETMTDPTGQYVGLPGQEGNFVAQVSAYEIPSDYYDAFANDSLYATDPTIADETAASGNTTYSENPTTGDITQTVDNANGSSTTTSFYPTDTGYQKAAGAFSNPASDGQLHPVNGGILAAQYGIQHKPGAGELPSGSTKGSQPGKGPQPQAGNGGQGSKPPTTKPTAPSPEGDGGNTNKKVVIDNNKFRYIFGKATGRQHNLDRSNGMALQMKRLGVLDNSDCIGLLTDNLQAAALDDTNVTSTRSTEWGTFIEKESLFSGPSGKFALFRSIWQLGADGELCFSSLMVLGG